MKILLIDDERLVRFCTESMLAQLLGDSMECAHANGAAQAEAWVRENGAPDLCFVDYKMPLCNGIELIRRLRPHCGKTVWVLVSGYDLTNELRDMDKQGIHYVLAKPVSPEDISAVLESCKIGEVHPVW